MRDRILRIIPKDRPQFRAPTKIMGLNIMRDVSRAQSPDQWSPR
jgi:hypothetical protein